jgi:hypothetical protein
LLTVGYRLNISACRRKIVDAFLSFVAKQHEEEISFLKQQIRDGGLGYA